MELDVKELQPAPADWHWRTRTPSKYFCYSYFTEGEKKNGHTARNSHSEQVFSLISLSLNFLICKKISTVAFVGQG